MISFNTVTEQNLTDALHQHNAAIDSPEHVAIVKKAQEIVRWPGMQRLAASVDHLYGNNHSPQVLLAVIGAICLRLGWHAAQDAMNTQQAMAEIGYLMSDTEMAALRKEIRSK
jgi:hypothetical protein